MKAHYHHHPNVMPELGVPPSIVLSGALYQSVKVLGRLSRLCPSDYFVSSGAVSRQGTKSGMQ